MKAMKFWHLIFATAFCLVIVSCTSPSISEEEWSDIGASIASSMKFDIAVKKIEAQAQERYANRLTLEYWEWDTEGCIHEVRFATLKHIVSYFHETSGWDSIPKMRDNFNASEVWTEIKDVIPSASKKLGNTTAVEQVQWTIDNVAKEYDRLNRIDFKLPEFVSKTNDREVFKSYCAYNDTYYEIVRTTDGQYLWDFSVPFIE